MDSSSGRRGNKKFHHDITYERPSVIRNLGDRCSSERWVFLKNIPAPEDTAIDDPTLHRVHKMSVRQP